MTALVYKQLRTLMDKQDVATFEIGLKCLIEQLDEKPELSAFAHFFKLHLSFCTRSWAYCYRARCGINTNMHLERMHGIFKHVYQQSRKNKHLDSAIYALMHMAYDKHFDRVTVH